MIARISVVLVLGLALSGAARAADAQAVTVGSVAPALVGTTWLSPEGKAPDLSGKVWLAHFWFAG